MDSDHEFVSRVRGLTRTFQTRLRKYPELDSVIGLARTFQTRFGKYPVPVRFRRVLESRDRRSGMGCSQGSD